MFGFEVCGSDRVRAALRRHAPRREQQREQAGNAGDQAHVDAAVAVRVHGVVQLCPILNGRASLR
jgi:hypothetical protein